MIILNNKSIAELKCQYQVPVLQSSRNTGITFPLLIYFRATCIIFANETLDENWVMKYFPKRYNMQRCLNGGHCQFNLSPIIALKPTVYTKSIPHYQLSWVLLLAGTFSTCKIAYSTLYWFCGLVKVQVSEARIKKLLINQTVHNLLLAKFFASWITWIK